MANRTPRNFNGTHPPGKKIEELLPEVLAGISRRGGDLRQEIFLEWSALLGEQMAPLTEPVSWVDGVFTVKVKSGTLYSLLCQHEKAGLLKRLQKKFPVRNLVFRVG